MSSSMAIRGERGQEVEESSVVFGGQLLPGFRFQPTDVQMLDLFLRRRLMSGSSATVSSCLIQEFDVYSTEPWNLPCDSFRYQFEEKAMQFFTPRHPTSSRSRRASRTAGCGFWQGNGRDNRIMDGSRLIGHKTQLTFMISKGKDNERKIKTDWIMHEFRLHSDSNNNTEEFDGMVLCRIYKRRSNNCCREGDEEEAKQRLAKRKRVEEHGCLMADHHNNEAGTCETVYSDSSSGQYVPLLSASSSSSEMPQFVSREEPECLSTPLASTNVAASADGEQGDEEEEEEALKRRVIRGLLEEYKAVTGRSLVVDPEPSSPEFPPSEPEGPAPETVDGFDSASLPSSDDLPPLTVDDFDFDNLCSPDELFGDFPIGT